ncbi:hypothetical protein EDB89DRAFT_1901704 [Lactarius sanguifluus]|nr:hypothetical protein EDB89DRAFT_1901704 [Lactarius sanguifluus]
MTCLDHHHCLGPHDDSTTTTGLATMTLGTMTQMRAMAVVGGPPTPTTTTATTTLQQSPRHDNDGIGHYGAATLTRATAVSYTKSPTTTATTAITTLTTQAATMMAQ